MSLSARALIAGLGVGLVGALGGAESARANELDVSATVPVACTVNPGSLPFGEYIPGGPAVEGHGSFSVTCTPASTDVNILLDGGQNPDGLGPRRMANAGLTDFLEYNINNPSGFDQWGDDGATITPASHNVVLIAGETTLNFMGSIPAGQAPAAGEYSDLVNISLVFN